MVKKPAYEQLKNDRALAEKKLRVFHHTHAHVIDLYLEMVSDLTELTQQENKAFLAELTESYDNNEPLTKTRTLCP